MDRRREADTGVVDEVARQRQKRSAARRDQLVGAATTVTVGQLADQAAAAITGADGTTESAQDEPVEALAHPSSGQQRLRTVAQLEALLLKTEASPTR